MVKFNLREQYIFRKLGNSKMRRVSLAIAYGMSVRKARLMYQNGEL